MSDAAAKFQATFYVSQGDESSGPWTIEEIAGKIAARELAVTDFIYDEGREDWIPILECEPIKPHLNKAKPKAPPPPKAPRPETSVPSGVQSDARAGGEDQEAQWFVQQGANRYGPMTYFELLRSLQEKNVHDFDFVWKQGTEAWVRIAEHPEFHPDRIREWVGKLASMKSPGSEVFCHRQYVRVPFESEVIVHDDRSVWMGRAFEAGLGGSGVVIENAVLSPGQVVRVHFGPCDGLPAFNALGEIVGKRYTREIRGTKSPVRYALRFLKLDGTAESSVREYFETKTKEKNLFRGTP